MSQSVARGIRYRRDSAQVNQITKGFASMYVGVGAIYLKYIIGGNAV